MSEQRPHRIGRYRVIDEIGRGGQGVVYRVHDDELGIDLAIKLLPKTQGTDDVVERMRREVLLSRRVRHEGICRLHDLKTEGDHTFLVMDYVEGTSLDHLIAHGALPLPRALHIVGALATAVAAVHAAGVVHRDLKPENVIVSADGRVVLVDFGVATAPDLPSLTTVNGIIGTRRYIAPEVWLGAPASALADVFALGVLLYECLTGVPPYAAAMPTGETKTAQRSTPRIDAANLPRFVPPSERQPHIPAFIDDVVRQATAAAPADRTRSALALAADIRLLQERLRAEDRADKTSISRVRRMPKELAAQTAVRARLGPARTGALVAAGCLLCLTLWLLSDTAATHTRDDVVVDGGAAPFASGAHDAARTAGTPAATGVADAGRGASDDVRNDAGAPLLQAQAAELASAASVDASGAIEAAIDTALAVSADAGLAPAQRSHAQPGGKDLEESARAAGLRLGDLPSFDASLKRLGDARTTAARERAKSWAAAALKAFRLNDAFIAKKMTRTSTLVTTAPPAAKQRAQASLDLAALHAAEHRLEQANAALNAVLDELAP